jgi:hypothetical protein
LPGLTCEQKERGLWTGRLIESGFKKGVRLFGRHLGKTEKDRPKVRSRYSAVLIRDGWTVDGERGAVGSVGLN